MRKYRKNHKIINFFFFLAKYKDKIPIECIKESFQSRYKSIEHQIFLGPFRIDRVQKTAIAYILKNKDLERLLTREDLVEKILRDIRTTFVEMKEMDQESKRCRRGFSSTKGVLGMLVEVKCGEYSVIYQVLKIIFKVLIISCYLHVMNRDVSKKWGKLCVGPNYEGGFRQFYNQVNIFTRSLLLERECR